MSWACTTLDRQKSCPPPAESHPHGLRHILPEPMWVLASGTTARGIALQAGVQHLAARRLPLRIMSSLNEKFTDKLLQMNFDVTYNMKWILPMCLMA